MTRTYRQQKRAENQEETRRRIVEATVELHGTVGPAQATISAIAERAGVQRATVYRHFPDEERLFDACTSHFNQTVPPPEASRWLEIHDPEERLRFALDELYAYFERSHQMFANNFRDRDTSPVVDNVMANVEQRFDALASLLEEGWTDDAHKQRIVTATVRHTIDFFTWRSLIQQRQLTRQEAIDLMTQLVRSAALGSN